MPRLLPRAHIMTGRHRLKTPPEWFDLDATLADFSRSGWTVVALGDRNTPDALALWQRMGSHADVLVLRSEDQAVAFRAPVWPYDDPLAATEVIWCWHGPAAVVTHKLLALGPVRWDWPAYPIPAECQIPELAGMRHGTIRPPQ